MKYFFIFLFILIFFNVQRVSPFDNDNDITFDDEEFMFNTQKLKRSNYYDQQPVEGSADEPNVDDEYDRRYPDDNEIVLDLYRIHFHLAEIFDNEYYNVDSQTFIALNDDICYALEENYRTVAVSETQFPCTLIYVREVESFKLAVGLEIKIPYENKLDFEQVLQTTIQTKGGLGRHSISFDTFYSFQPVIECKEFLCFDGKCISRNKQCDSSDDCLYGEDEINCGSSTYDRNTLNITIICRSDQFYCDNDCKPKRIKCDGNNDCSDGKDEEGCNFDYTCPEAKCDDGSCIYYRQKCDGTRDCYDNSDEQNCCRPEEFRCGNGVCIYRDSVCDGKRDCFDNSDELNCAPTPPPTRVTPHIYPPRNISCYPGQFACRNQRCLPESVRCDGRNDCGDYSDENNCSRHPSPSPAHTTSDIRLRTYPGSQKTKEGFEVVFRCRDEGSNRLPVKWSRAGGHELPPGSSDLNGRLEIPNIRLEDSGEYVCEAVGYNTYIPGQSVVVTLTVEKYKLIPESHVFCNTYNESTCMDGVTCIDRNFICDGRPQCPDSSDEFSCSINRKCQPNQFVCRNGKCVARFWRCDGENDCGDNSDEESCGTAPVSGPCSASEFQCRSGHCIPKSFHCDQTNDCADGTDEIGCQKPVVIKPPPPSVTLSAGSTLNITCHATGNPIPEIVWRLNWGHVPKKCFEESSNGIGTLVCPNMQNEDSGAYSCEMINPLGIVFVTPDTIVRVEVDSRDESCHSGSYEVYINNERRCTNCFCSGVTTQCAGVPISGQYNPVREISQISKFDNAISPQPQYTPNIRSNNGYITVEGIYAGNENLYVEIPSSIVNQKLDLFGGVLKYNLRINGQSDYSRSSADVILVGSRYNLYYYNNAVPDTVHLPLYPGKLLKANNMVATNEEIITTLTEITNILVKISYSRQINVVLSEISVSSDNVQTVYKEQCSCPPGYSGSSCERCQPGYTRNRYGKCMQVQDCPYGTYGDLLRGIPCSECPCPGNGRNFADGCKLDSYGEVACNCRRGYTGKRCQYCADGFIGNPLYGECTEQINNCDRDGTYQIRSDGSCVCKPNVDGPRCDRCKPNSFFLNTNSDNGCINCFCMGVSSDCTSSSLLRDTIYSRDSSLSEISLSAFISDNYQNNLHSSLRGNELIHNRDTNELLYWKLPSKFLDNKVTSYGGFLNYTLRYAPSQGGAMSKNAAADVIIKSANEIEIQHFKKTPLNPGQTSSYFIPLFEQFWQRKDKVFVNREYFLMALSNIEAIYIKATYTTTTSEVVLNEVSMDYAVSSNTGRPRAFEVEQCVCPVEYTGLSCENCAPGYTRNLESGLYLGNCERCSCNGNSEECDSETGACKNCQNHSTGDRCDECEYGYVKHVIGPDQIVCQYGGYLPDRVTPRPEYPPPPYTERTQDLTRPTERPTYPTREPYPPPRPIYPDPGRPQIDSQTKCFCSGTNVPCAQQTFKFDVRPFDFLSNPVELYDEDLRTLIDSSFYNFEISNNSYTFVEESFSNKYWSLPRNDLGNMIKSYGGHLEFELKVDSRGRFVRKEDIIVERADGRKIYWQSNENLTTFHVSFDEKENWFNENGSKATRADIMLVLSSVDRILIRASQLLPFETSSIGNVVVSSASDEPTYPDEGNSIEVCSCPRGYLGTSCEQCDRLHFRNSSDTSISTSGSCHMCPCQVHVESCSLDEYGRIVYVCSRGFTGYECKEREGGPYPPPTYPERPVDPERPVRPVYPDPERPVRPVYPDPERPVRPVYPDPERPVRPVQPGELVYITPNRVDVNEGAVIQLTCQTRDTRQQFRYVWQKDNTAIEMGAHIFAYENVLYVRSATVSDSGEYRCEARSNDNIYTSTAIVTIHGTFSGGVPVIHLSDSVFTIPQGESHTIACNASGNPQPVIRWTKMGDSLGENAYQAGDQLIINNAGIENRGLYICFAENEHGTDESTITVDIDSREKPTIQVTPEGLLEVLGGNPAYLSCRVSGFPTPSIEWRRKDGQRLPTGWDNSRYPGDVTIHNTTSEVNGVYECVAVNPLGSLINEIEIRVLEYPQIQLNTDSESYDYTEGDEVDLECKATGNPLPNIRLECDGKVLQESSNGEVRLYIPRVTKNDAKEYVCIAESKVGEATKYIDLEVRTRRGDTGLHDVEKQPYSNDPGIPQYIYKATYGDTAVLNCDVEARNNIPLTVTWERVDRTNIPSYTEVSDNNLVIRNIDMTASGLYQCNGIDERGQKIPMIRALLHVKPVIHIYPQVPMYVTIGQTVELTCNASGADRTNWHAENFLKNTDIHGNILRIRNINPDNEGKYFCTASNMYGEVTKETSVHVKRLDVDTTTENANEGDTVRLDCDSRYSGYGSYRFKWRGENSIALQNYVDITQPTLYLSNVQAADAGKYYCDVFTANNQIVSSRVIDLTIHSKYRV